MVQPFVLSVKTRAYLCVGRVCDRGGSEGRRLGGAVLLVAKHVQRSAYEYSPLD